MKLLHCVRLSAMGLRTAAASWFMILGTCGWPGLHAAEEGGLGGVSTESMIWRSERTCGTNCLYVVLRTQGVHPDYRELMEQLSPDQYGNSLRELRDVAASYGVPCALGKTTRQGLRATPKPIITHMDVVHPRGEASGHYIVVVGTDEEGATYIDGTSAHLEWLGWEEFERFWSGFILYVEHRSRLREFALLVGCFAGGCLLGVVGARVVRWRGRRRGHPESRAYEGVRTCI